MAEFTVGLLLSCEPQRVRLMTAAHQRPVPRAPAQPAVVAGTLTATLGRFGRRGGPSEP
ncbi:hypothetical protein [Streptomyces sp. P9-A4]|uniref:hypothetical protein n=1 Tax=Streptomyces sp. P9-A4 TaxID=3072285 RepID=UPI002FCC0E72